MSRRAVLLAAAAVGVLVCVFYCEASSNYHDCSDAFRRGVHLSGLVEIKPGTLPAYKVFCRMDLREDKGWTVIQRRQDGSINFNQNFETYQKGFGYLEGEYWIGLDRINQLTQSPYQHNTTLRVKMCTFDEECGETRYNNFKVLRNVYNYRAYVTGFDPNSTAGDAMGEDADVNRTVHLQSFSARNRDVDSSRTTHCARESYSGWWHNQCWLANLNGVYLPDAVDDWKAIHWFPFSNKSLEYVEMMVFNEPLC